MPALYPRLRVIATSTTPNVDVALIKKRKYPIASMVARSSLNALAGRNRTPLLERMSATPKLTARPRLLMRPSMSIAAKALVICQQVVRASTIVPPSGEIKIDGNQKLAGAKIVQGNLVNLYFSVLGERLEELDILLKVSTLTGEVAFTKSLNGRSLAIDSSTAQPNNKTLLMGTGNLFAYETLRLENEIELSYQFLVSNSVISREHLIESGTFTLYKP